MARRMDRPLMLAHIRPTCHAIAYAWIPPSEDPAELLDWLRTELTDTIDLHGLTVWLVERCGDDGCTRFSRSRRPGADPATATHCGSATSPR
jgi:hypothetical protein